MRKSLVIVGLILALIVLCWAGVQAVSYTLDLFGATKYSSFRVGMSARRAKSLFSSYGELLESSEMDMAGKKMSSLTFSKGELRETLRLEFTNDKLSAFSYTNWEVK